MSASGPKRTFKVGRMAEKGHKRNGSEAPSCVKCSQIPAPEIRS
jgi:hypothetical protein